MKIPNKKDWIESAITIGATALVVGSVGYILYTLQPKLIELKPRPSPLPGPVPPIPPTPGPANFPIHIIGPLTVSTGRRYNAVVNISSPLSILADTDNVREQSEKQGFTNVRVFESRPIYFPPGPNGDYYIEGTYNSSNKTFDRNQAGGRVTIIDAWMVG